MLATAGTLQVLRARIVAYEQFAITTTRHLAKTCHFFHLANLRYPATLTELGTSTPPYIPPDLMGNGTTVDKQGYRFTYALAGNGFTLNADPQTPGVTGVRHFYVDEQVAIHADEAGPADANDPIIP